MARGQQATGRVTVEPHQADVTDEITVDIAAQHHEWETSRGIVMCLMERKKGERGVGIFVSASSSNFDYTLNYNEKTPKHLTWTNRRSEVEVTVKIPHQMATSVIELPRFEVLTPDFQVTLPNVDEFVTFHDLDIRASNMPVSVGVSLP